MRICVLGKRGSVTGWAESAVAAWRAEGHAVLHAVIRDPRLHPALERALYAASLGAPRAALLARRIRRFAPDLLVATGAFDVPLSLLARMADVGVPKPFGWVGDAFGDEARARASYFAAIGYTDTLLAARHAEQGLDCPALFLPHAAHVAAAEVEAEGARDPRLLFVGNPTPLRRQVVAAIARPIVLYGPGWHGVARHEVHARRIAPEAVAALYRRHAAVLNMRHEINVLAGLNQRSFAPYLGGAAVVSDAQPDLDRCFRAGEDVLVWRDTDELNTLYERLLAEPSLAATVAARGRRRVLAEHSYAARLRTIAATSSAGHGAA